MTISLILAEFDDRHFQIRESIPNALIKDVHHTL
jgi:uncharacterized protein YbaR (Trm112 family)